MGTPPLGAEKNQQQHRSRKSATTVKTTTANIQGNPPQNRKHETATKAQGTKHSKRQNTKHQVNTNYNEPPGNPTQKRKLQTTAKIPGKGKNAKHTKVKTIQ